MHQKYMNELKKSLENLKKVSFKVRSIVMSKIELKMQNFACFFKNLRFNQR